MAQATPTLDSPDSSRPAPGAGDDQLDEAYRPPGDDAQVHAAGSFKRGALRWGYFLLLNAIAAFIAAAMFIGVLYGDGLDPYMQGTYDWLLAHPGVTSLMAFSPLACSLLVGYGYASRARRRKAAAAKRAQQGDGQDAGTELPQAAAAGATRA